jgi:hypothetical protein
MKFLREFAYVSKKVKKSGSPPRELSSQLIKSGSCTTKETRMCFILIADDSDPWRLLTPLSAHYLEDKIDFYYISKK